MLVPGAVLRPYRNREMSHFEPFNNPHALVGDSVFGVMAGLVPAIHDQPKPWIRGSSPRMTNKILGRVLR